MVSLEFEMNQSSKSIQIKLIGLILITKFIESIRSDKHQYKQSFITEYESENNIVVHPKL